MKYEKQKESTKTENGKRKMNTKKNREEKHRIINTKFENKNGNKKKQAGAELGQAQLQLELAFTLNKVCCIILMITNYHYISLSTISL